MVVRKRKKVTKYRAHTTHGGGHRKKRRGAGSRGGRGRAGTGKRAGQKKAGITVTLGRHGFIPRRSVKVVNPVNIGYFTEDRIKKLLTTEKITKEADLYCLDLSKLGYTKLLGTGTTTLKLKISVDNYTSKAEQKITAAGGMIEGVKKEAQPEQVAQE